MVETDNLLVCKKCLKAMDPVNFYVSNNTELYPPDGKMDICKKCLTMHVNNFESSTFLHILEKADVPYIPEEWEILLNKYGRDKKKLTGTTILGRYLAKMHLRQFCDYRWADTERLMEESRKREEILGAMEEERVRRFVDLEEGEKLFYEEIEAESGEVNLSRELSLEDKKYLALKWGKLYTADEWIALEQFYEQMTSSFDIQTAAHFDYLKMICKTSLKMNQAIDGGDIEGFAKLQKAYDSLMKSAKFTAVQNKAENGEFIDSVGELVYLCEQEGFIPRYHTPDNEQQDIVDATLKDMKGYLYNLVTEEMGLGNMIESALIQMQREENKEESEIDEDNIDSLFEENIILSDTDYEEYFNTIEEQKLLDEMEADNIGIGETAGNVQNEN